MNARTRMILGVVLVLAAPFLGWPLHLLVRLMSFWWGSPSVDCLYNAVIPGLQIGGIMLFVWGLTEWIVSAVRKSGKDQK